MKRNLFIIIALFLSLTTCAQDWIFAGEGNESTYYVYSTVRKTRSSYLINEKSVPIDLNAERERLFNIYEDTKYYRFAYLVVTEIVDIDLYRTKSLSYVYYDTNGSAIHSFNCDDDDWRYAKPGTILESICETVEYLVNGNEAPSYTSPKTTQKPIKRNSGNQRQTKGIKKGQYIKK